MIFDKNQTEFPSQNHKAVWQCAVQILPKEISLSEKVKGLMDADLFESCRQMREFMLDTLQNIYEDVYYYDINPQSYFRFWFDLIDIARGSGKIIDDCLVISFAKWGNNNTKAGKKKWKAYFLDKIGKSYDDIFSITGIHILKNEDSAEIISSKYPKIFHAMIKFPNILRKNKESISSNNSFYFCDFRKLCPEYEYEKSEKSKKQEIEDSINAMLDEKSKPTLLDFIFYLRENKMKPSRAHIGAWKGLYKGKVLYYIRLPQQSLSHSRNLRQTEVDEIDSARSFNISLKLNNVNKYEETIFNEGLQDLIWNSVRYCRYPECTGPCSPGVDKIILGKKINNMCHLKMRFVNPDEMKISIIKKLLELEKQARKSL